MSVNLTHVSRHYQTKRRVVPALEDVSFSVPDGALVVLMGPSGSGKSTLLQLISGIEPPDSGQIVVDGTDLAQQSAAQLNRYRQQQVGIIFQQFYLDPNLTVQQNMELPAMFTDLGSTERQERTKNLAQIMGLTDHLDHRPAELSGGQIQRTAVARAIYNKPRLLLADEPTSNLDPANVAIVLQLLRQIQQAYGATLIIATHDQTLASHADLVVQLDNGRVV